jgi:hypothetical protein
MYTEEDKRDMRQMFDDYIRLRIRELMVGIKDSASTAMWQVGETHRYRDWEDEFRVSFRDILKRMSEIDDLLSKKKMGKDLMEHGIYSMADYKEKVKDEEECYDDDDEDDDAVYTLTKKGRLTAMLNDPKYFRIDGNDPVYDAIVRVLKDTYENKYGSKDEEEE